MYVYRNDVYLIILQYMPRVKYSSDREYTQTIRPKICNSIVNRAYF